ncbi:hypothetical protein [Jiella pelagia]|uniref:Rho termination factor, N-terminal domain n=1 Tax=Jiella pelagia TaxID=2986949 RepID=A0ABY7BV59_9HYPH|nr:hypothetical protein [Jiella pelagia]WAP67223.1 hypothetical protein OH818_16740 [Jiella pelagia]
MAYKVIAECVDRRTGQRYLPGPQSFFPADDPDQVDRLERAGCLRRVADEDLSRDEEAAAALAKSDAARMIAGFEQEVADARRRRDETLAAIETEVIGARQAADAEIARINEIRQQSGSTDTEEKTMDPAAVQRQQINEDKLFDSTVEELRALAKDEDIDLSGASRKDEIVAAIRAARAKAG